MKKQLNELSFTTGFGKHMSTFGKFAGVTLGGMALSSLFGEVMKSMIAPALSKTRFKNKFHDRIRSEVLLTFKEFAAENNLSLDFVDKNADKVVKGIMRKPIIRNEIKLAANQLSQDPDSAATQERVAQRLAYQLKKEGVNDMAKIARRERLGMQRPRHESVTVPMMANSLLKNAGMLGPQRRYAVRIQFVDGEADNYVTIENEGKSLQINPDTREAYLNQGPRRVYLGAMDQWDNRSIKRLIERYLGTVADAVLNRTLRELGLVETTSTSSPGMAMPAVGFSPGHPGGAQLRRSTRKGRKKIARRI